MISLMSAKFTKKYEASQPYADGQAKPGNLGRMAFLRGSVFRFRVYQTL
jgi:hypothetical protein